MKVLKRNGLFANKWELLKIYMTITMHACQKASMSQTKATDILCVTKQADYVQRCGAKQGVFLAM